MWCVAGFGTFVQFKKREKHPQSSVAFSEIAGFTLQWWWGKLLWMMMSKMRMSLDRSDLNPWTTNRPNLKSRKIYEKTPVSESLFNKVATLLKKRLWHRCFPVNFAKFSRAPFLQNTSGRLLELELFW